jgi:hypothetical protein
VEPAVPGEHGERRRADLELFSTDGKVYLVDVTVGHPTAQSHVDRAAQVTLATAHTMEAAKTREYAPLANHQHAYFMPCALESYGGVGRGGASVVRKIAHDAEANTTHHGQAFAQHAFAACSVALCRGNAHIAHQGRVMLQRSSR